MRLTLLQRHKEAVAEANLRQEFLSGAGCASFLLMEDSDIENLLQQAGRPGASNSAAMEHGKQLVSDAEATGHSGSAHSEECTQEGGQMTTETTEVQACPDGITEELGARGREISQHFTTTSASAADPVDNSMRPPPCKRICLDDIHLDRRRVLKRHRTQNVDDLHLDKRRMRLRKSSDGEAPLSECGPVFAEDAPT